MLNFEQALIFWYLPLLLMHCILPCCGQSTSGMPSTMTHGELFQTQIGKNYPAQPSVVFFNTTSGKCTMSFASKSQYLSMNVIKEDNSIVRCEIFRKTASKDVTNEGILIDEDGSIYYEKNEIHRYIKGSSLSVVVKSKNEQPGTVTFQPATGFYKIKLKHIKGSIKCTNYYPASHFSCIRGNSVHMNAIMLVKDFRGAIVAAQSSFTKFEANWMTSSYVGTSQCYHLIQGSTYSFWYTTDHRDLQEGSNSGKTSFDFLVEPCNYEL